MTIKETLKANIIGHWDFRKGTLVDQSGNKNASFGSTPYWLNGNNGRGMKLDGVATYVDVGDTTGTVKSIYIRFNPTSITSTTDHIIDLNGTDFITVVNGTVTVNGFAAATTAIYSNGSLQSTVIAGQLNYVLVTSDTGFGASDMDIGRLEGTGFADMFVDEVILFDNELSSAQYDQLHAESLLESYIGILPKRNFQLPEFLTGNEPNIVGGWNMNTVQNQIADVSSGGNEMTKVNRMFDTEGVFGRAIEFDRSSSGHLRKTVSNFRSGDSLGSIEFIFSTNDMSNTQIIFAASDEASTTRQLFVATTAIGMILRVQNGGASEGLTGATVLQNNVRYHCVVTSSGTTWKIYVEGVEDTPYLVTGSNNGNWFADISATDNATIGAVVRTTVVATMDGPVDIVAVYDAELSSTEVAARYQKFAQALNYRNTFEDESVTVTALGSGDIADFHIESGTWKVTDDGTDKWMENITAGIIQIPLNKSFGTWEFDLYKELGGNSMDVMILADVKGGSADTGQDGYGVTFSNIETISVVESVNGTPTDLISSTAQPLQTKVTVRVTRDFKGEFTLYLDGVSIGTATDITVVSNNLVVCDFDAGDKISNIKFWEGVVTPSDLS